MADLNHEQRTALRQARLIWAALLMGQVAFGAVLLGIRLTGEPVAAETGMDWIFAVIPALMLLTLTPLGYFIRNQCYKSAWQGDVVSPTGYVTGNIILLAMLEGTGFTGLVMMFLADSPVGPGLVAALAMAVQAINFPTGEPMRPHPPDFTRPNP